MCRAETSLACADAAVPFKGASDGNVEVEVVLLSGEVLAANLLCKRSEGLAELRARVAQACGEALPFRLLHGTTPIKSLVQHLQPLEEVAGHRPTLTLVRLCVADLSDTLVGPHGAASQGNLQALCDLLDEGADIDWRDGARLRTPLMWAAAAGHREVARELLRRGAEPILRSLGSTAAQLAEANEHWKLAATIRAAECREEPAGAASPPLPAKEVRRLGPRVEQSMMVAFLSFMSIHFWQLQPWEKLRGCLLSSFLVTLLLLVLALMLTEKRTWLMKVAWYVARLRRRRSSSVIVPL